MTSFLAARSACTPVAAAPELLAVEHGGLLEGELHGGVALGAGPRRRPRPSRPRRPRRRRPVTVGAGPRPRRPAPWPPATWRPPRGRRRGARTGRPCRHDARGVSQRARMAGATTPAVDDRALRPRSGSSAKALLLTVLGELVLPHGGGGVDVDGRAGARPARRRGAQRPPGARPARRAGHVRSEKQGRRARWHLTDAGRRLLVDGTARIYALGTGDDALGRPLARRAVLRARGPAGQAPPAAHPARVRRLRLPRPRRRRLPAPRPGGRRPTPCSPSSACSPARWCSGPRPATSSTPTTCSPGPGTSTRSPRPTRRSSTEFAGPRAADGRRPLRRPRRARPRVAALPVPRPRDPGPRCCPPHWPGRAAHGLFADRHDAWSPGAVRWYARRGRR